MKKNVYLQFDTVANLYVQVIIDKADPEDVVAGFRAAARAGKIDHSTDDFDFYRAGFFDDRTGGFETVLPLEFVCHMREFSQLADALASKRKENKDVGESVKDPD